MRTPHPSSRADSGYSLAEVLAALVILGILVAIATPRMSGWTQSSKNSMAINEIAADLSLARLSAIRDGNTATFAIGGTGASYTIRVTNLNSTSRQIKSVNLRSDYPGLTLGPAGTSVVFDSRGLRRGGDGTTTAVSVASAGKVDRLLISPLGKVNRDR